jgi:hypothetical protein
MLRQRMDATIRMQMRDKAVRVGIDIRAHP